MAGKAKVAAVAITAAAATTVVVYLRRRGTASLPVDQQDAHATLRAVTIDRPPTQVYDFWRDLRNLASALDRPTEVEILDERRSVWTVRGPAGRRVHWTAEIIADEPGRLIAWRVEDGPVPHEGRVEFSTAPSDRGTQVQVGLRYRLAGGKLAAAATKLSGDEPDVALRTTLRRVKQLIESGHVVTVEGQSSGRGLVQEKITRLAQHRLSAGGRP